MFFHWVMETRIVASGEGEGEIWNGVSVEGWEFNSLVCLIVLTFEFPIHQAFCPISEL